MTPQRTILVTGPTGGIGATLCTHLAAKGYNLVLAARSSDRLEEAVQSLSKSYPEQNFKSLVLDFADLNSIATAFAKLRSQAISLHGLVVMPPQIPPTDNCLPDSQAWEPIWRNSFVGPLEVVKQSVELFPKTGRSKIVIVSGISSAQVLGHYATSNVLRLAWLAEAKTIAFALGPRGIHVNTLSLGGVVTEKFKARIEQKAKDLGVTFEQQMEAEVANVPLKKYAEPREVACAVEGLLSEFSDHMTGLNILCDGGFTRAY